MRILVGVHEIAGWIPVWADGFRRLGHDVATAINKRNLFYLDYHYDIDLNPKIYWPQGEVNERAFFMRVLNRLHGYYSLVRKASVIPGRDLFFFMEARFSLLPEHRDYYFIKKLGKPLINVFVGDDVRDRNAYLQWHVEEREYLERANFISPNPLAFTLTNLRMAELYSDLILSVPNQSPIQVRPYMHLFLPVDLAKFKFNVPGRDIPLVIHAPSDKGVKGTDIILRALEQLQNEGVKFDLKLLHNVPHQQVVDALEQADILVDELYMGLHGTLTVEAMASGCAVATINDEFFEPIPPNRPICAINPVIIKEQLRKLLTDKEWRIKLAHEGRKYVEQYHDHVKVAQRILEIMEPGKVKKYDHYPEFFARSYQLPEGQVIPERVKRMTTRIVNKWGLPADVDVQDMVRRGLLSADGLLDNDRIPRWNVN